VVGMLLIRDLASLRALLALVHHLAGLLIGVLTCILMVTLITLGFGLLPVALIGLPILGATLRLAELIATAERARFGLVLGARPAMPAEIRPGYRWGIIPRWRTLASRATWGAVVYALLVRPVVSAVALWSCLAAWAADSMRPPTSSKNRAVSGISLTINVESVLLTSN